MKLFASPILCLAMLQIASAQQSTVFTEWFSSNEGGFSVVAPGMLKQNVERREKAGDLHQFVLDRKNGAYLVTYESMDPQLYDTPEKLDAAYERGLSGVLQAWGGKLLKKKEITISKNSAREYTIDIPARQGKARVRMLLANGKFYQTMALGGGDFANTEEADSFLDSFELN